MDIRFDKMHGLGNDFMVINAVTQHVLLTPDLIRELANRHTGVGFDQCLIVEPSQDEHIDFYYRIFNSDGNEVAQCGNGARCLARFINKEGLSDKKIVTVATHSSVMQLKIENKHSVLVDMGEPTLAPEDIPLSFPNQSDYYGFEIEGHTHYLHAVSVGNPHGVMIVDQITNDMLGSLAPSLSKHPLFPEGANISFVELLDPENIRIRTYERGVGETMACGSAAVAAMVCVRLFHEGEELIKVSLPGGTLSVYWKELGTTIKCQGPATTVFEGKIPL